MIQVSKNMFNLIFLSNIDCLIKSVALSLKIKVYREDIKDVTTI